MQGRGLDTRWAHQLRWRIRGVRPALRKPLVRWRHRGLHEDDAYLAEYPKSGGTWLAFMLGEIVFDQAIDFESQGRFMPAVGFHRDAPRIPPLGGRLLRTHEPRRPEYERGIYLVRHIGDVAVSYYKYLTWLGIDPPSFKQFLRAFLHGHVEGYGPWPKHVESWLQTSPDATLVIRFEDLRTATEKSLRRILNFLGLEASDSSLAAAIHNNTMEKMRTKQESARTTVLRHRSLEVDFVRKGAVGDAHVWLDSEDMGLLEAFAGPTLRRLGYSIDPIIRKG